MESFSLDPLTQETRHASITWSSEAGSMIHAQNPHTIVLEPYLQNHFCKRHVPEAGFLSEIAPHVLFSSLLFHYLNKIPGSHPANMIKDAKQLQLLYILCEIVPGVKYGI